MLALLEAFPDGRSVVLLDNFEDFVDAGTGAITDPALDEALRALLTTPEHGVKVMITTRVAPRDLLLTQPAAQRRLNLDEGLASPHAENILRAMDPDGSLGLKTAPDALLARARDRTRGYPRALEALVAILAADRDTTLSELLTETERLPDNVVHALVGEAFSRLEPLAQQVMQALAVYPVPVPSVAVDYLLQPYRAAVNAAPVLTRLVNMHFVRRDAGRYYLHQVDRDYALHSIPSDGPADQDTDPPPFTQHALRHRGATYFAQTRTPRETWKALDDIAPQFAEFELRCQSAEYDAAADVLHEIDFDHLILWGHSRLAIDLHQRLHGHLTEPKTNSVHLSNLGLCYADLGQISTAIDHYQPALAIDREIGDRRGESADLGNLGNCYAVLGQTSTAIDHHQQALTISREIGDRRGEAMDLGNLGDCYADLGQIPTAVQHCLRAIEIADEVGSVQTQCEGRVCLARAHLLTGDFDACRATAESAIEYDYPPLLAQAHLLLGIAQLLREVHRQARQCFTAAVRYADAQLRHSADNYANIEYKALALCGLALTGQPDQLSDAIALFSKARAITTASGIVARTLRLFDAIAARDTAGCLTAVRLAAQGELGES